MSKTHRVYVFPRHFSDKKNNELPYSCLALCSYMNSWFCGAQSGGVIWECLKRFSKCHPVCHGQFLEQIWGNGGRAGGREALQSSIISEIYLQTWPHSRIPEFQWDYLGLFPRPQPLPLNPDKASPCNKICNKIFSKCPTVSFTLAHQDLLFPTTLWGLEESFPHLREEEINMTWLRPHKRVSGRPRTQTRTCAPMSHVKLIVREGCHHAEQGYSTHKCLPHWPVPVIKLAPLESPPFEEQNWVVI